MPTASNDQPNPPERRPGTMSGRELAARGGGCVRPPLYGTWPLSDLAGDRDRLRTAMETVNIQTPLGSFQFTSNHDVKQTVWIIQMDGNGGFTLVHEIKAT